jgi:sulfur carrier protein
MKIVVNGKEMELNDDLTVTGLLESLEIDPGRVAVEVNLKIIKRDDRDEHKLNEGDSVEIVNFVGGG